MGKQLFLNMYFIAVSSHKIEKEVTSVSTETQKNHLKYEHDCKIPIITTIQSEK